MRLNLGSGRDLLKGYINADISPHVGADEVFDVKKGIPFNSDVFDEVRANNVLTQIADSQDFINVMNELWRVTKHGGSVIIRVPIAPYENAFRDPIDSRVFTEDTFDYLLKKHRRYRTYGKHYGFLPFLQVNKVVEIKNDFGKLWGSMVIALSPSKKYLMSDEACQKRKGRVPWNKGKKGLQKMSKSFSEALSKRNKRLKIRPTFAGKKHTTETRGKMSEAQRGEKGSGWKGGLTAEKELIRNSMRYKEWRRSVFERDNYTCVNCGTKSGVGRSVTLNADHIKPFTSFPELRFAIDNGRTLCVPCHRKTDTYGYKAIQKYATPK